MYGGGYSTSASGSSALTNTTVLKYTKDYNNIDMKFSGSKEGVGYANGMDDLTVETVQNYGGNTTMLIADDPADSYTLPPKPADIKELADGAKNLLRIGSATIQPKAFEDYIFYKGRFVMVDGGKLAEGKMFLDLNQEQAVKTRGVLDIGGDDSDTTGIADVERVTGTMSDTGWYTLDGRRLSTAPVRKGIYIQNGNKVVIR